MAKVLLIEDDSYYREDLLYFLENAGHDCTAIRGVAEFFELVETVNQYDYVILDLMMRRNGRFEDVDPSVTTGELIYEEIIKRKPNINIIVFTAKNESELSTDILKDSHVHYQRKPLDSTEHFVNHMI